MTSLDLARWQFGITTVYHFLFVPLTIGLAAWVAICQTAWYRTGNEQWKRATKFWGKLMLISFALGVVTGIVQEFQFGMNWSNYSRFVGDIFGAPLAMEGLAAFFVESTFLGLWIFGWGKLSPKVHLACIWAVSLSTALSAFFILAANSWMQHPVGYELVDGKAELTSIFAVLGNSTALYAFAHTLLAAAITGSMMVIAISAWHILRGNEAGMGVFSRSIRAAIPTLAVAALVTVIVGHFNGILMTEQQPMKMAAADAVFETKDHAGLSLFATGDFKSNPEGLNRNIEIPNVLSYITTGYPNGEIKGINDINAEYQEKFGPGEYAPIVAVAYWSWRAMLGVGFLAAVLGFVGWWLIRKNKLEESRPYLKLMVFGAALPFIANTAGWIFTEMGRQPWVVFGMLKTSDAGSPAVSTFEVLVTLIGFTLLYLVLAIIAGRIFLEKAKKGPDPEKEPGEEDTREDDLALAY
ncbi:MAG: cytochrome ubiquinol oxidase subunit I [Solirubrobacterales bacterium]|nr:cytochrome ubiquinol oxidase subunit I [Solirubrobacterales bacterium]MCB8969894.1 cytochrome ubiquinol oxidase subunit I [Thermoleophilales bacterium]MCO5327449.1 cytochrome ubiquinol oxidase subunit I [Solirubrobacterales bacterium]